MTNYPPGTSRRDLKRAGIITDPIPCPECDAEITSESHEDWCDLIDADTQEVAELAQEQAMHQEYDPLEHKDL